MYKNFKLTEEERISIREQHSKAVKKEFNKTNLNEVEDELNNPYWLKIKNALVAKGYKFEQYDEKGSIWDYMYSGKNPFKNYQHGRLKKGEIGINYPATEVEGGQLYRDMIRVYKSDFDESKDIIVRKKYGNIMNKDWSTSGGYFCYVKYVNEFLSLVNDLEKL